MPEKSDMYEVRRDCKSQLGDCNLSDTFYYKYILTLKTNQI